MEYNTPGVYIREVDSGAKPIASVSTSIPGFLGLFHFTPPIDATAVTGSNGKRMLKGKVPPQLIDEKGMVKGDAAEVAAGVLDRKIEAVANVGADRGRRARERGHEANAQGVGGERVDRRAHQGGSGQGSGEGSEQSRFHEGLQAG